MIRYICRSHYTIRNFTLYAKSQLPHRSLLLRRSMTQVAQTITTPKYCANCGRLISPNHRNFAERKYCSKSCNSRRLSATDHALEQMFRRLAVERGSVECGEVQRLYGEELEKDPGLADAGGSNGDETTKRETGMDVAVWRERVRRAGRRVVVFPQPDERSFECVQKGKPVEPSFAKGEWAVRIVKT